MHHLGMRSCKCTRHDLYVGRCQSQWQVCVSDAIVSACMSRCVCVCVSFLLLCFKLSSGCLFSQHQSMNLDGVHCSEGFRKGGSQVTLYKHHTAEESLRRRRSGRHSQVLPGHAGRGNSCRWCFPPHQRVCVNFFPRFFVFLRIFPPIFLVRVDPNLCRCVLLYVSGRCRE